MEFMAHFTMGTGGHYITMLPADWSIPPSRDPLPSSCQVKRCFGICLYILTPPTHLASIQDVQSSTSEGHIPIKHHIPINVDQGGAQYDRTATVLYKDTVDREVGSIH